MTTILNRYKEIASYLIFGICTTGINLLVYTVCTRVFGIEAVASTVVAWVCAVLFAFFTNRRWVFHSDKQGIHKVSKEALSFFSCRISTGLIETGGMYLAVDVLSLNDMISKFVMTAIVIILNYIASKLLVFTSKA